MLFATDEWHKHLINEVAAVEWIFSVLEKITESSGESEKTKNEARKAPLNVPIKANTETAKYGRKN